MGEFSMTPPKDDLEAVRTVAEALEGFDANAQERIIRWAREKLGLATLPTVPSIAPPPLHPPPPTAAPAAQPSSGRDVKTFVDEKKPKSDVQFAASVAYFHRFEAPAAERKNEIGQQSSSGRLPTRGSEAAQATRSDIAKRSDAGLVGQEWQRSLCAQLGRARI